MSHQVYVSLNAYNYFVCVHGSACAHSVTLFFAILNVFHTRQSTKNTFLQKTTTSLSCTRTPSTFSQLQFSTECFVHKTCFVSVNR